jgi:hypothetical protein
MKWILILFGVLALAALGCAIQAPGQGPNALGVPTGTRVGSSSPTPNALEVVPTRTPSLPYSAKVTEPLTVRAGAGEEYQALGYLDPGDAVTVYNSIRAKDGGLWASIDGGYVNSRFLDKIE